MNLADFASSDREAKFKREIPVNIHNDILATLNLSILCVPAELANQMPQYTLARDQLERLELSSPTTEENPVELEIQEQNETPTSVQSPSFADFAQKRAERHRQGSLPPQRLHSPTMRPVTADDIISTRHTSIENTGMDEVSQLQRELADAKREIAQLKNENQLLKERLRSTPTTTPTVDLLDFF
jgi:hypothetical protein